MRLRSLSKIENAELRAFCKRHKISKYIKAGSGMVSPTYIGRQCQAIDMRDQKIALLMLERAGYVIDGRECAFSIAGHGILDVIMVWKEAK